VLDRRAPDRERLFAALELGDSELIDALAGSRRAEVHAAHRAFAQAGVRADAGTESVCRHCDRWPAALAGAGPPRVLHVRARPGRLGELTALPAVALIGCGDPSEYGTEMAAGIARGLSACAVTVIACVDALRGAPLSGALEAGARCLALAGDGLRVKVAGSRRELVRRAAAQGCVLSELPAEAAGRLWGRAACEKLAVELADVVVLVEGRDGAPELASARWAAVAGKTLGAIPGRAGSPLAAGPHGLLREGASLVCAPEDVLELIAPAGAEDGRPPAAGAVGLEPRLQGTLDAVAAGSDTPELLARSRAERLEEVLLALSELELLGLLARGRSGRYLARMSRSRP
jgi:DNA processing protein